MKNTTIDTTLLPDVWLTWETTKGKFYMQCSTGQKQLEMPECVRLRKSIMINSGSKPRYAYAKYHANMECLELAEVTVDTTRKEIVHEWKYSGKKYFLKKDKTVLDENGNVATAPFELSRYHVGSKFSIFLGMFYRIAYYNYTVEEFKKFLGSDTYTVGSGRTVTVHSAWHIQEWYKTKQKVRKPGKQQKLTDMLTAMPVSDTTGLSEKYPPLTVKEGWYNEKVNGIIYFERLEDGWSVLRVFDRNAQTHVVTERERMYLHDDGANRIVAPSKDGWVPSKLYDTWSYYRVVNEDEAKNKCNRLKYILPLMTGVSERKVKNTLMTILRFPELEQMISLGYKNDAKDIAKSNTPRADLYHMFGDYYNDKESSLLRKAGLTKHQFDTFMARYTNRSYSRCSSEAALKEMRKLFGENLTPLDNATFDKYFQALAAMHRGWGGEILSELQYINVDRTKFIKNVVRLYEKHTDVCRLINDTLNRYRSLNRGTHPEINWYFDNYSDVVRAHDAIDALKRQQDDERRAMYDMQAAERRKKEEEKRIKLDKERQKYEYEDDTYVIRLPKDSNEIVSEGSKQRICIGGYVTSHALGHTNLFFLRRKNDPNAPFYAIEMSNNNVIVQIHGFGNSWLGNNPEAIPTVVRWLRKNGIKCDEKILTCKAKGYCSVNDYVPMPVVD